ncbi:MAG TPA: hypothetical protein VFK54_11895 [Candidatus Limnocylindrales bacterium]|nr:hypothetical protein [Candidatus Limnocylindrales bacterium]
MDGWVDLIGGVAGVVAVAFAASWLAAGGSNALAGLVAGWREPGWPRGVQEEDDVRWTWRSPESAEAPVASPTAGRIDPRVIWRGH